MIGRLRKYAVIAGVIVFSFTVLFISIFRTAAVKYSFIQRNTNSTDIVAMEKNITLEGYYIDYVLAHPGPVLPGHVLWPLKALRDRIWLMATTDILKKAELNLLFADKRISSAKVLFERGDCDTAYAVLTKSANYLKDAQRLSDQLAESSDRLQFDIRLAKASLKHRQVIKQIMLVAPDEAKPKIVLLENYLVELYKVKKMSIEENGLMAPQNPFENM